MYRYKRDDDGKPCVTDCQYRIKGNGYTCDCYRAADRAPFLGFLATDCRFYTTKKEGEMKRYDLCSHMEDSGHGTMKMFERESGEWVKWGDVKGVAYIQDCETCQMLRQLQTNSKIVCNCTEKVMENDLNILTGKEWFWWICPEHGWKSDRIPKQCNCEVKRDELLTWWICPAHGYKRR